MIFLLLESLALLLVMIAIISHGEHLVQLKNGYIPPAQLLLMGLLQQMDGTLLGVLAVEVAS